jgi:hypothetical protein
MPRHEFDKSSKYLVQHHARGMLLLGGAPPVRSCRAAQAELVQPRKLPDGMLEVVFEGRTEPDHVLVEVATYPEKRALKQALDDLSLARQHLRGVLPELLMLVLCPQGRFRISGQHKERSRLGWSELGCEWKVVELWTLPAEELLAAGDVGVIPWVPLAKAETPPAELLEQCRERIEKEARPDERENLLAVAQVMARLRFPQPDLLALLGGKEAMIESPLIQELQAEYGQNMILEYLKNRFGKVPSDVRKLLSEMKNPKKLTKLFGGLSKYETIEDVKDALLG